MPIPTPAPVVMPPPVLLLEALLDARVDEVEDGGLEVAAAVVEAAVGADMSEEGMEVVGAAGPVADHVCGVAFVAFSMAKEAELDIEVVSSMSCSEKWQIWVSAFWVTSRRTGLEPVGGTLTLLPARIVRFDSNAVIYERTHSR